MKGDKYFLKNCFLVTVFRKYGFAMSLPGGVTPRAWQPHAAGGGKADCLRPVVP